MPAIDGEPAQREVGPSGDHSASPVTPEVAPSLTDDSGFDVRVRLTGIAMLVAGLALGWWEIWVPIWGGGSASGHWGRAGGVLLAAAVVLPVAGLACAAFGQRAVRFVVGLWPRDESDLKPRDIGILLGVILPLMAIFFWVLAARSAAAGR